MPEETKKRFEEKFPLETTSFVASRDSILSFIESECQRREEEARDEFAESLLDMYYQYCDDGHYFMSAGEHASELLERYGYSDFDEAGRPLPTNP